MEHLEEKNSRTFYSHVFQFNDESKADVMNLMQYAFIAIIPIILLNKLLQRYMPPADDDKGSIEMTIEIIVQLLVLFFGLYMIHRFITYFPTYSGMKYPDLNIVNLALVALVILLSIQTKLGEKVTILVERVMEFWDGKTGSGGRKKKGGNVKVTQPISGGGSTGMENTPGTGVGGGGSTMIASLPVSSMYSQDYAPLQGASTPGGMESFSPMAANEAGAFASPFR